MNCEIWVRFTTDASVCSLRMKHYARFIARRSRSWIIPSSGLATRRGKPLAEAFGRTVARHGYTCYVCAVCRNHAHLIVRVHRDKGDIIWRNLVDESREETHPTWSQRPYAVFLHTPQRVRQCVRYVEDNPVKEGLSTQRWDFVVPYDNWPFHGKR